MVQEGNIVRSGNLLKVECNVPETRISVEKSAWKMEVDGRRTGKNNERKNSLSGINQFFMSTGEIRVVSQEM
jgi:hypothetical protein